MESVTFPVIVPSNDHRCSVVSVSTSTQSIDNEIVANKNCWVCVVDLVSTSAESIDSNLPDIKKSHPLPKQSQKVN